MLLLSAVLFTASAVWAALPAGATGLVLAGDVWTFGGAALVLGRVVRDVVIGPARLTDSKLKCPAVSVARGIAHRDRATLQGVNSRTYQLSLDQ